MDDQGSDEPPPTVQCQMCHRDVPPQQIVVFSGRQLCFGCAGEWFNADDEDDEDS